MSNRFAGKVLLTTGGGSGLAAAVARRFAREGGRVAVLDIDGARARSVAAELQGSTGMAIPAPDPARQPGAAPAVPVEGAAPAAGTEPAAAGDTPATPPAAAAAN